jgi:hypothetical protein
LALYSNVLKIGELSKQTLFHPVISIYNQEDENSKS